MRQLPLFVEVTEADDLDDADNFIDQARDVYNERRRAHALHDGHGQSMERKGFDNPEWLPVVVEEVGEVGRALNDMRRRGRAWGALKLREELIQTMAMCSAWVDAIDMDISEGEQV